MIKHRFVCANCGKGFETPSKNASYCREAECQRARKRKNRNNFRSRAVVVGQEVVADKTMVRIGKGQASQAPCVSSMATSQNRDVEFLRLKKQVEFLAKKVEELQARIIGKEQSYWYEREVGNI